MKVAVIGAGPAGLISEKYALDQGFECDVYEKSGAVGGTWNYTDSIDFDENDLPVHSSMYKGLITNLPKETMTYLDVPYPKRQRKSYIPQQEVLDYFNHFADNFDLRSRIKFYKNVTKVQPLPGQKWTLTFEDTKTKVKGAKIYHAVFVCNGHYQVPFIPGIPGKELFKGLNLHSHAFRTAEIFTDKTVLVIGAAPSGQDISRMISLVAHHIFLSHANKAPVNLPAKNISEKVLVKRFTETGAVFEDGTEEVVDAVLFCTGYQYSFPFLTKECGITVTNNWVHPLYKHIINVEYPTMFFIGIPFLICVIPMFDLQARFALAALGKQFNLPSKEDMVKELEDYVEELREKSIPPRQWHKVGCVSSQAAYFQDLAETANIRNIPIVISKLYQQVKMTKNLNLCFEIIDEENYTQIDC